MILKDLLKQLLNELEKISSLELAESRNKTQEIIIKAIWQGKSRTRQI